MAHRDEAKAMLASIYKDTIDRIRNGSIQRQRYGEVKLSAPVNASIDPGLFAGLSELLLDLGKQPVPVISVSAHEKLRKGIEPGAGTPEQRERALVEAYTLAVRDGVGKELVEFALAPPEAGAMIEVEYEPAPAAAGWRYLVTVKFRLETDGNVIKTVRKSIANPLGPETSMRAVGAQLGVLTAGSKKLELQVLEE